MNRCLFVFVDGTERRRALVVTAIGLVLGAFIFPWWAVAFAAVMSLSSILLRPSADTLALARQREPAQLQRGSESGVVDSGA
jgi:hypothetical protein